MTKSVECPHGDPRWKLFYKSDPGQFAILMLDHSNNLTKGIIKKMPTNVTYCIQWKGFNQYVRSDDCNEVRDFVVQLVFHSLF